MARLGQEMIVFSLDHLVAVAASRLQATASLSRTAALGQPSFAPGYSHASHCPLPHALAHAGRVTCKTRSIPQRHLPARATVQYSAGPPASSSTLRHHAAVEISERLRRKLKRPTRSKIQVSEQTRSKLGQAGSRTLVVLRQQSATLSRDNSGRSAVCVQLFKD